MFVFNLRFALQPLALHSLVQEYVEYSELDPLPLVINWHGRDKYVAAVQVLETLL